MSNTKPRRLLTAFLAVNVLFGTVFAGMAAGSALALDEPAPTETIEPTAEPTVEPTDAPVDREPRRVARAATLNPDGSTTITWDNGLRDEADPNFSSFQNLSFTVSKSTNLTYEIINVSWEGGQPTSDSEYAYDFMQIMQCWDDGSGVADPRNCQFGMSTNGASLMGQNASTRNLSEGEDLLQEYGGDFQLPADPGNPFLRQFQVPFQTPAGDSTFDSRQYFDAASTNEVIAARVEQDGTGVVPFEVQTSLEAPHLGCGGTLPGGGVRDCFLVIVPRGQYSVDGSAYYDGPTPRVSGSPLSASAWANRVEFPLEFQSVKSGCPIGAAEERTVGNEIVAAAFNSWQSAMCKAKTVFGFSQIGDSEARRQIVSDIDGASRFAVISNPLTTEEATGSTVVYGPLVQSAIVVAFNIEYDLRGQSELIEKNGRPVTELVLNQRLVAKLLTQSYKNDVADGANQDYLSTNPSNIAQDPEFLDLNPEFAEFQNNAGPTGILQPIGNADVFRQLWQWIVADEDAKAFLNGTADEWGMVVNKYYRDLNIPDDTALDSLPKADLSTYLAPEAGQAYGTFELRPYVSDLYDAAVRTRRADPGTKIVWDQTRNPPAFVASGPQNPGTRFIMGITDVTTATRLKLPMAKLVNGTGNAVEPTDDSITTAIENFSESSVAGVTNFNPSIDVAGAYPLATVAYAAVSVCDATLGQLSKYNKLLTLAKGKGQNLGSERGQLPEGYVPLSAEQKSTLGTMIAAIKAEIASPVCPNHSSSTTYVPPIVDSGVTTPSTDAVTDPVEEQAAGTFGAGSNNALKYSLLSALFFGAPFIAGGRALVRKANAIHD
jgi:hypothetical protein